MIYVVDAIQATPRPLNDSDRRNVAETTYGRHRVRSRSLSDSTSLTIRLDLYSNDIPYANHIQLKRDKGTYPLQVFALFVLTIFPIVSRCFLPTPPDIPNHWLPRRALASLDER